MAVIAFVLVAVILPSICANLAARRRDTSLPVVLAFVLQFLGVIALGVALLAWIFNGYSEDAGTRPVESLQVAVPLLIVAVITTAVAWFLALRPRTPDERG